MCATCGCAGHVPGHDHDHPHPHDHDHDHAGHTHAGHTHGAPASGEIVRIERDLLAKNDHIAGHNRRWLAERGILAVNLVSSPGAGKTTLLEATIRALGAELGLSVIEGDQATEHDAARIRAAGAPAVQVNTGAGCHLDADMVARALASLAPRPRSAVMIENVGNLVCPALFDLGERAKVVVSSVTEGDDKPLKYPYMFREAGLVLLNKVDLLPYVRFDVDRFRAAAAQVNPRIRAVEVSATRGDGMEAWYAWLREHARAEERTAEVAR
jgi:hydrogenase nickel incorporation protein HypB